MRILLLGGTGEANDLASALEADGHDVITSVAGRTATATGDRVGGFGGASGLADFLMAETIDSVVDATHPFAVAMTRNAAAACQQTGVRLIRLERPSWCDHRLAETWTWVASHDEAALAAADQGRVLLTVGRQPLAHYVALPNVVARVAEAPDIVPTGWDVIATRGPFRYDAELALLHDREITVLVTKDSGGDATAAKLDAAADAGVEVIMVRRPPLPTGIEVAADGAAVAELLRQGRVQLPSR